MRVICEQEELWREINPCEHLDKGVVCYRRISSYLISQARFIAPGSGKVPLNADCWNIKGSNFKRQVEVFVYLLQIELEWKMNNSISGVACDVTDLVYSEITGMVSTLSCLSYPVIIGYNTVIRANIIMTSQFHSTSNRLTFSILTNWK